MFAVSYRLVSSCGRVAWMRARVSGELRRPTILELQVANLPHILLHCSGGHVESCAISVPIGCVCSWLRAPSCRVVELSERSPHQPLALDSVSKCRPRGKEESRQETEG